MEHGFRADMEGRDGVDATDPTLLGTFRVHVDYRPGEHTVMTRATDVEGNIQPEEIPFNEKGYLFNQPVPHPIRVT